MKPPVFDYVAADTLEEALELLGQHGDEGRVIAGGQSLVPLLAMRLSRPSVLIDLNRIEELKGTTVSDGMLRVGAMTRQAQIERDATVAARLPGLAAVTRYVGHIQTRNRGTIGGSVAHADPAAEYPAFATALGAEIETRSKSRTRAVPAEEFFKAPYSTVLQDGEIVTAIRFPLWGEGTTVAIEEVARRHGDFALVGVVAAIRVSRRGQIDRAGISWLGMGPAPARAVEAEGALVGQRPVEVDADEIAQLAAAATDPWDDTHASSRYRRAVGSHLAGRVLRTVLGREVGR